MLLGSVSGVRPTQTERHGPARLAFAAVMLVALALRVGGAFWLPNVIWPDEIFQTLEQGHRLAFGYGIVPWEFRAGARSWFFPGLLGGIMAAVGWAGRLAHVRAAQVVLSTISLVPVAVAYAWARPRGRAAAVAAAAACASWFELILYAPKALNEVVAGHVLLLALLVASRAEARHRPLAAAGALLALVGALRIQLAPAVLVAAAFAGRRNPRRWIALASGAVPMTLAAGLLDLATWSHPFQSYLATFTTNVIEGRSRLYGTAPWYAYLDMVRSAWSWALLPLIVLAAIGAHRRLEVAACAVAVLAAHVLIPHKEYRFVYPAILLLIVLAALGTAEVVAWIMDRTRVSPAQASAAAVLAWAATSAALGARSPDWTRGRDAIEATRLAGARSELCGLALIGQHWASFGGYTYLHRDVPVYLVEDTSALAQAWRGFDTALVSPEYAGILAGFAVERCWDSVCVARRAGGCAPVAIPTVNLQLAARGE